MPQKLSGALVNVDFDSTFSRSPGITRTVSADIADWNPFDDNFGADTEEEIFGKEFDKLRRGSNSSKYCTDFRPVFQKV